MKDENNQGQSNDDVVNYLTKDELDRADKLWKILEENEDKQKRDARPAFEMIYLGCLKHVKNRKVVEAELKDLQKI